MLARDIHAWHVSMADVSASRFTSTVYAGIVVLEYATLEVVERQGIVTTADFPYRPGFLSFREAPYCAPRHVPNPCLCR
jgi:deoxyinosine 3'endonuclease (endonuclease V)